MGFTANENMVRVDFFKPSGKWYTTEEMNWDKYISGSNIDGNYEHIIDTFKRCVAEQFQGYFNGMRAVCLEPYHEYSHPLMIVVGEK
jgi:hypothetical protein